MRYFELTDDMSVPGRWHLGEITTDDGWEPPFWSCTPFAGNPSATIFRPGRPLDFCLTSFGVPVATARIATAIESVATTDIERIPIRIPGHAGFVVLNALRCIVCLDEDQSEFIKWTDKDHRPDLAGQYRGVTRLIVKKALVPRNAHFFRIKGWLVALIVSESVKEAMEELGCVGAKFHAVSE